ncbi:MAG: hypothetical protein C4333_04640 [Meiothermus sp.]
MPSSRAARMAAFLAEHHTRPVRPAEAARMVGLNPNYAAGLFLRHFGMTPTDYLTALRVAHAQRLLLSSELGVLEVALESGFGSPSRFYAAFTRLVGESPGAFRRRLLG